MPSHYEEQERQLIEQYKKSPHYRDPATYSEEEKLASDARVKELQDRARARKAERKEDYWGTAEIRAEADRKARVFEQGRALSTARSEADMNAAKLQIQRAEQGIIGTFGKDSGLTTSDLGSIVMGDDGKLLGYRFGYDTDYVPIDQLVSEGIIEDPRRTATTEDRPPRGIAGVDWFPSDISKYKEEDSSMPREFTTGTADSSIPESTRVRINEIKNRFFSQSPGTRNSIDYYNALTSLGYNPTEALQQLQQWEDEGSLIGPDPAPVQQQDLLGGVPGETVQERVENFKKFTDFETAKDRIDRRFQAGGASDPYTYIPPATTAPVVSETPYSQVTGPTTTYTGPADAVDYTARGAGTTTTYPSLGPYEATEIEKRLADERQLRLISEQTRQRAIADEAATLGSMGTAFGGFLSRADDYVSPYIQSLRSEIFNPLAAGFTILGRPEYLGGLGARDSWRSAFTEGLRNPLTGVAPGSNVFSNFTPLTRAQWASNLGDLVAEPVTGLAGNALEAMEERNLRRNMWLNTLDPQKWANILGEYGTAGLSPWVAEKFRPRISRAIDQYGFENPGSSRQDLLSAVMSGEIPAFGFGGMFG
jgi:hypothetical protein